VRTLSDARLMAQGQCDVFVTIDKGFEHEHNLKKLSFGIIIIHVAKNRMECLPSAVSGYLASG
jgi:hypothetical protein